MKVLHNIMLALALGLGTVGMAFAEPGHGGAGEHGRWGEASHGRGYERGREHGRPGRGYAGPGDFGPAPTVVVGRPTGIDRSCGDFGPCGYAQPAFPRYGPGYGPAPRPGGWRRGDFMPRDYWNAPDLDPGRHRLRTPPPGYGWRGAGRDAYLIQRSTGLILDTAPGAW